MTLATATALVQADLATLTTDFTALQNDPLTATDAQLTKVAADITTLNTDLTALLALTGAALHAAMAKVTADAAALALLIG